jgi:tetratricopeptide (TPR) repeat protein
MAKVIKFPMPEPEKFGPEKVRKKKGSEKSKTGQLPLFTTGKVVRLHQLSPFDEALILDEQGDKAKAKVGYLKAIEDADSVADALCNLAIIESQEGQIARAIDHFTQCLKHEPRHHEAHYNLANLYAEVGNFPLAKIHYQIAIEIEPSFSNSYFNLGLTLAMVKEFKEAVKVIQQYRHLTPQENHKQTDELLLKLSSTF